MAVTATPAARLRGSMSVGSTSSFSNQVPRFVWRDARNLSPLAIDFRAASNASGPSCTVSARAAMRRTASGAGARTTSAMVLTVGAGSVVTFFGSTRGSSAGGSAEANESARSKVSIRAF